MGSGSIVVTAVAISRCEQLLSCSVALLLHDAAYARCTDRPAAQVDWAGCKKSQLNLSGFALDGAVMVKSDLTGTDFSGTSIKGADLSKTDLSNAGSSKLIQQNHVDGGVRLSHAVRRLQSDRRRSSKVEFSRVEWSRREWKAPTLLAHSWFART